MTASFFPQPGSSGAWRRYHFVVGHWCFWDCKKNLWISELKCIHVTYIYIFIWYHNDTYIYIYMYLYVWYMQCINVHMHTYVQYAPWKMNMEPNKWSFGRWCWIFHWAIFWFHVNYQGCIIHTWWNHRWKQSTLEIFTWIPQYGHIYYIYSKRNTSYRSSLLSCWLLQQVYWAGLRNDIYIYSFSSPTFVEPVDFHQASHRGGEDQGWNGFGKSDEILPKWRPTNQFTLHVIYLAMLLLLIFFGGWWVHYQTRTQRVGTAATSN